MSIDRTQATQPIGAVQPRDTADNSLQQATRKTSVTNTQTSGTAVTLSSAQSALTQSNTQDINTQRVEELKQAIRDGKLTMDIGKIADGLLQDTQDYLKGI